MRPVQRLVQALAVLGACSVDVAGCAAAAGDDPEVSSTEQPSSIAQWTYNVQIPGMLSQQSPALAAWNGSAYLNHSSDGDTGIWWARYQPSAWNPDARVDSQASSATPSLAAFNGLIYMFHVSGNSGATQVWYSRFDPVTQRWSPDSMMSYQSVGTPTIQAFHSKLHIIGVTPGSKQLWHATIDGSGTPTPSMPMGAMYSATPVALAVLDNRLYMVHRTGIFNTMVLNSSSDGDEWGLDVQIGGGFNGGPQTTPDQAAIAAYGGVLHLVHNETDHPGIWWSFYTPSTGVWSAEVAFPSNQSMQGFAALAALPTQLLMVHHGGVENTLWYSVFQ